MRELCLAAPQRLTVQITYPECVIRLSIKPATDTVVACAVQLYVCPSQVLYAHTARSVLHVSPGPDAAHGGTSLSGGDHPRYTAFDSHDGPVVMLTCQGFCGPPDTVCAPVL
jgi:hypothetical protein